MHISNAFQSPKGHVNYDFVDISLSTDTPLFIDPCLIKSSNTPFCQKASSVIDDYFNVFFNMYSSGSTNKEKLMLFEHAHEINATKLGYGNGKNGKAKTPMGMLNTFKSVDDLFKRGICFSHPIDLPIFIEDFAEDCLSDMLTNILSQLLNDYTVEQCARYGIQPQNTDQSYYYWNTETHSWELSKSQMIIIDKAVILLVPKHIICKNYYYNAEQYFRMIISERIQQRKTTVNSDGKEIKPYKKDIKFDELAKYETIREMDIAHTISDPSTLTEYHARMPQSYTNRYLTDDELDDIVYKKGSAKKIL